MIYKIRICIFPSKTFAWEKDVKGIPIVIRGFEFMSLFMYQADGSYDVSKGPEGNDRYDRKEIAGRYFIAEERTGCYVSGPYQHPEQAYSETEKYLNNKGYTPQKLAEACELYGV